MFKKSLKYLIIVFLATSLVTIGIKASDSLFGDSGNNSLCPSEMVFIPSSSGGFCIDRYEASPGKGCPIKNTENQKDSRQNISSMSCQPSSVEGAKPWVYVSQAQAREICARAGKRLATNKEWFTASLGTPDKNSSWNSSDCQVSNNWREQPGETGSGKNCVSSFGAFDMIGNVWEWTNETINNGKLGGEELPEQGYIYEVNDSGIAFEVKLTENKDYNNDYLWIKHKGLRGIARGGFYSNEEKAGIYSAYLVSKPSYTGTGIGFRCVQ